MQCPHCHYWNHPNRGNKYREYLQTPEWKKRRNKVIHKARRRCQICNAETRLNVHHRTYARRGNEDRGDLIALCESCHAKFHDKIGLNDE
jgi:5-methylcytosine-specific restriction endonuclease McrA